MTLREKICDAGVSTLREFVCATQTGGGGIGYVSILEAVFVQEEQPIMLDVLSDDVEIREEPDEGSVIIEEDAIIIEIIEDEGDSIDVVY